MAVAFEELEGSPRVQITEAGTVAHRYFRVAWSDWVAFARELVGRYRLTGGAFSFQAPMEFPGMPNLLVSALEIEPFEPSSPDGGAVATLASGTNGYPAGGAQVTATYRTAFDQNNQPRKKLPPVPKGTYLTFDSDIAAEYVTTPGRTWRWKDPPANDRLADDINPGLLIPQASYRLVWHRVPLPPWDKMRELRGKVNAAEFIGAPVGTVLFTGSRSTREFQFVERGGFWKVEYFFQEHTKELSDGTKVGWNHFYKEAGVAGEHWVSIEDEDGNPPYRSGDLNALFQFGT